MLCTLQNLIQREVASCTMNVLGRSFIYLFLLFHPFMLNLAVSTCPKSFNCGFLGPLEYPLANYKEPDCGLISVNCSAVPPKIQLGHEGVWYEVRQKISTNKFGVTDTLLLEDLDQLKDIIGPQSCSFIVNQSLPQSPLTSFSISPILKMFSCTKSPDHDRSEKVAEYFKDYKNYSECAFSTLYYKDPPESDDSFYSEESIRSSCSIVEMPVKLKPSTDSQLDFFQMFSADFELEWKISDRCVYCHNTGKKCVINNNNYEAQCQETKGAFKKIRLAVGITIPVLVFISVVLFLFIRCKDNKFSQPGKELPDNQKDIEFFLKNNGNLAPRRYKYSDLKKITKSFSEKLGNGGYGSVYKGKLRDGRLVAVKILNKSKGNGEEFLNEVASISRTSHINIVKLLGFCFDGASRRALVYDFMPNGSLEKFLQNSVSEVGLGWKNLFEIAVGVARGLEYLHRLCNMRIVHFDIKPHNILLDKDFNPKISDFGLAKLCPNRSSTVSMLVARGTIGYIAPEVFCRNFGGVSHKSDVYSYGMMVLEIAGETKNVEPKDIEHSSEIYFPQYIYKQLEIMDAENPDWISDVEDESQIVKRKLTIVGLWCIQTDPNDRPSMSKVVEMLEGKLDSLQIPPKPYLSSPLRSPPKFSISESM